MVRPRHLTLAAALLGATLGLAWFDVLPGSWRLRSLLGVEELRAERLRAQHRARRLEGFEQEGTRDVDVLLLGSSTIERAGDALLRGLDLSVANRGIGDEPLALLAERLGSTLRATTPEVVVLYLASVDARRPTGPGGTWLPIPDLVQGAAEIVDRIQSLRPGTRVLLLGTLPETTAETPSHARIRALDAGLQDLAAERRDVRHVPTRRAPLVDPRTGLLDPRHATDRLHLAPRGYDVLNAWLEKDPWIESPGR